MVNCFAMQLKTGVLNIAKSIEQHNIQVIYSFSYFIFALEVSGRVPLTAPPIGLHHL
jgi:hypothetical protein